MLVVNHKTIVAYIAGAQLKNFIWYGKCLSFLNCPAKNKVIKTSNLENPNLLSKQKLFVFSPPSSAVKIASPPPPLRSVDTFIK